MNLEKILDQFGLEKNKGAVYIATLQLGSGKTQDIASKVNLPRTTVHEILQHLVAMGLIGYITKGRTRVYTAESPDKMRSILLQKEEIQQGFAMKSLKILL